MATDMRAIQMNAYHNIYECYKSGQMLGVLADMGIDAEPIIDGAIEAIEDTATRAKYRNDWRYAGGFVRQHPLFNDPAFMALLGMTSEQIDTLWAAAQGYPA